MALLWFALLIVGWLIRNQKDIQPFCNLNASLLKKVCTFLFLLEISNLKKKGATSILQSLNLGKGTILVNWLLICTLISDLRNQGEFQTLEKYQVLQTLCGCCMVPKLFCWFFWYLILNYLLFNFAQCLPSAIWKILKQGFQNRSYFLKYVV